MLPLKHRGTEKYNYVRSEKNTDMVFFYFSFVTIAWFTFSLR